MKRGRVLFHGSSRLHSDSARVVFPGGYIRATFVCEAFWVSPCCKQVRCARDMLGSIQSNLVHRFGRISLSSLCLYYEDTTAILHVAWLADKVPLRRYVEQC